MRRLASSVILRSISFSALRSTCLVMASILPSSRLLGPAPKAITGRAVAARKISQRIFNRSIIVYNHNLSGFMQDNGWVGK